MRPSSFSHVIGQDHVKQALQIAVDAGFQEGKRLDEVLLCGPPGLGKTALVQVLADECCVPFTEVLAQSITNAAELNSALLSSSEGILFLDEIHLLHPTQQHALLIVLDKRRIFLSGGKSVQSIPVAPFTLIGATTDPDGLISPLVDRFKMVLHLDYYSHDELGKIVQQRCLALHWEYEPELLAEIAQRGRQTPRIALRLLGAARRVAVAAGENRIEVRHLLHACQIERISSRGLDNFQQKYIRLLRPASQRLNVLASMIGVSTKVVTATIEPFLLRSGLVVKSDNGLRQLSQSGREHLSEIESETA
ncbi:MAG: AAA family ATPase [Bacteroidales bacterium]|nr:AAA family ATPase [Bacteroidales bacterium]